MVWNYQKRYQSKLASNCEFALVSSVNRTLDIHLAEPSASAFTFVLNDSNLVPCIFLLLCS